MKNYLIDFFEEFEYEESDRIALLDAYDKICEREDSRLLWQSALDSYERDVRCDYKAVLAAADEAAALVGAHKYTAELLIFICMSKRLRALYAERGVNLAIYHDSMLDLKYKLDECKTVKGVVGSFVAFWFPRFFYLERVAFGRLQFEINKFGKSYERDGRVLTPDSRVVNIHIPRTLTPLSQDNCDESFARAREYFKSEFDGEVPFACTTWLLYPENERVLSEKSNVYKFMKRFDIFASESDPEKHDLWRIFDTDERDISLLPTDTHLRRAYVEHLTRGGTLGRGSGVFFM